jgi:hypothetical protein
MLGTPSFERPSHITNQRNIRPFPDRSTIFEFKWNFLLVEHAVGWESAMAHQYKAGDVVTVFQITSAKELVIEGKATIRKRVADVDEQYRGEFANKPGVTYERFVDNWGQDDPEKYIQDFNRRSAR